MNGRSKYVVMLASGALLLGVPAAASGPSESPMTTKQAAKAFKRAVCPVNETLLVMQKIEKGPDVNWETLQAAVIEVGDAQIRTADKLAHPKRPWPADVSTYMSAMAELDFIQGGATHTLASAGSFEEYQALLKGLQKGVTPTIKAHIKAFVKARKIVHKRLELPKDSCA